MREDFSSKTTWCPYDDACIAADKPAIPAPTIITRATAMLNCD